jgi:predicted DNA-binding transcriptional regulator AlpA
MANHAATEEQRLLLKPARAAELLGISDRQLWQHTAPRGDIPAVKIGACVRYSVESLRLFIQQREAQS